MPELRKDPVTGRWVIIATERVRAARATSRPALRPAAAGPCVLCAGREHETPPELLRVPRARRAANGPGWRVRVVPNKFPTLRVEGELERRGHGIYDLMNGVGAHEVVIESPRPRANARGVAAARARGGAARVSASACSTSGATTAFAPSSSSRTPGTTAASRLEHPHTQVLATPVVPPDVADELLHGARSYFDYRERCLFCDILQQETDEDSRVVAGARPRGRRSCRSPPAPRSRPGSCRAATRPASST